MPGYSGVTYTNFGRNTYLRSTRNTLFESYTCARSTVPADADGNRMLQAGTVMAKITAGADSGKIGPYSTDATGVTDGRSATANIVGICDSFFPYQLTSFDQEVSVLKAGRVVQTALYEYNVGNVSPGTRGIAAATKTALVTKQADLDLMVF